MFCSKCGKEIANDSMFCNHCGTKINISSEIKPHKNADTQQILKQDEFSLVESGFLDLSVIDKGKLNLFCDRVEWIGSNDKFILQLPQIISVGIGNQGNKIYLEIRNNKGETYKFQKPRKGTGFALFGALLSGDNSYLGQTIETANHAARTDFDSWRSAIERLRGI